MIQMRILHWSLILGAILCFVENAGAADTNVVRLAIGPFFAPAGNESLEQAASELPDMLAASLPQEGRFQLVERDKVNAIWSELHLAQAGLTAADSVARLGHVLSCDWLVSGSFVTTESATQIWVKVINTQDSTVIDLQDVPYIQTNVSATAQSIAAFLAQARSRTQPREFIALGKFNDWSISTSRENWAPRLATFLEKRFLADGYGVVEREAVAPIFAEYQFQAAGLTRDSTNHLKLKPAFWIVDGGCKWIHDTQDKLSVSVRVQKMGRGEQEFLFAKPPGDELLNAVWDSVQTALSSSGSITLAQAQAAEEKLRATNLQQLSVGRGEVAPLHIPTNQTFITLTNPDGSTRTMQMDPAFLALKKRHGEDMDQALQQAILLNPKNMSAKFMMGMSLFGRPDATLSKQGADLLEEVAASGEEPYATRAKNWLSDIRSGKITLEHDAHGMLQLVQHGQSASIPPVDTNAFQPSIAELKARTDKMWQAKNLATRADPVAAIPASLPQTAQYDGITAVKLYGRKIYIGCGTALHAYSLDANADREIHLAQQLTRSITAIECDGNNLWLGTDDGLFRLSLTGGAIKEFGEHDGFPTATVTALQLAGSRLFIGFNGAFGYLDTRTEKFTGLMAGVNLNRDWYVAIKNPPASRVLAIQSIDGNNFWVSSMTGLQYFNSAANSWSLGFPMDFIHEIGNLGPSGFSANPGFVVLKDYMHCFAVHSVPGTNWASVNLEAGQQGSQSESVALDQDQTNWLWIGGDGGKVTLMELPEFKIIAEGNIPGPGIAMVTWIVPTVDKVIFIIGDGQSSGTLHSLDKAALFGAKPVFAMKPVAAKADTGIMLDPRQQFLQANFGKFKTVQFQKDASGFARLQRVGVAENTFSAGGTHYCGFKFTVPSWIDGDFVLRSCLAKTESQKDFTAKRLDVHLVTDTGDTTDFADPEGGYIADCPQLQKQLPYTHTMLTRTMDKSHLQAGKTYAVAFEFDEPNLPDIAFAIAIDSPRGEEECGKFPEFDAASAAVTTPNPPTSAEELRTRLEAAIKAKDRSALIGLVCWQDVPDETKELYIANTIEGWLQLDYVQVKLAPPFPIVVNPRGNDLRPHPNIPALGELKVQIDNWGNSYSYSYGKTGNGFLLAVNVTAN